MTQTYFPFATGAGSNASQAQWGQMAQYWLGTGVIKGSLNELSVYADSTGMQCKVKSGSAWIQGFFYSSDVEVVMPISTANATNPRIDRVALQVDWTNNNITLIVLNGTPASSPTPPALTQNSNLWQISLAQVYVGANVTTIASGNITDERVFTQNAGLANSALTWNNVSYLNGYSDWGNGYPSASYAKDNLNRVWMQGMAKTGAYGLNNPMFSIPAPYKPKVTYNKICAAFNSSYSWGLVIVEVNASGAVTQIGSLFNGQPNIACTWVDLSSIVYSLV